MKKLTLAIIILIAPLLSRAQINDPSTLLKIGDSAPSFSFDIEKNKTVKIEDYRGKIVMINFFATWCPPCREELPRVQKEIWDKFSANPKFALFILGREEGWEKVTNFKETNKYTLPMLPDEGRKVYGLFATQYIPRNVVLDENGKIIYQSVGYNPTEFDELLALLQKKLN